MGTAIVLLVLVIDFEIVREIATVVNAKYVLSDRLNDDVR
jgi:hypothetical protein